MVSLVVTVLARWPSTSQRARRREVDDVLDLALARGIDLLAGAPSLHRLRELVAADLHRAPLTIRGELGRQDTTGCCAPWWPR